MSRLTSLWAKQKLFFFLAGFCLYASLGIAYEASPVANGGDLVGKVIFVGTAFPPRKIDISKDQEVCGKTENTDESLLIGEGNGLQNVLVSILNIERGKEFPDVVPTLDQKDCRYVPHLVLVPVGRPLSILNSDGILHSVHTHSKKNAAFNRVQSKFKKEIRESFSYPEVIKLTCDVHSWMLGWIIVQEHPYMTISGEDGSFEIAEIPEGEYEVRFWHELLGKKSISVLLRADERQFVQVEMSD